MTPIERAKALFDRCRKSCTCGGVDIGVGVMHEPTCGLPTPDDVASAIQAAVDDAALADPRPLVQRATPDMFGGTS